MRPGNRSGLAGTVFLSITIVLQGLYDSKLAVPATIAAVISQWTAIILFVVAGVRRPRAWWVLPVAIAICMVYLIARRY